MKETQLGEWTMKERTILVNDTGYFFDFQMGEADKKLFVKPENINPESVQVIEYPSYDDIIQYFKNITQSHCIVILNKHQEREINLLSVYFKVKALEFRRWDFLAFTGSPAVGDAELKKLAEKKMFLKAIYVFLKLREEFGLNPSRFKDVSESQYCAVFNKDDFKGISSEKYPETLNYLNKAKRFDADVFLCLMFYELTGCKDEKTELLLDLLNQKDIYNIPKEAIEGRQEAYEFFLRVGTLYEPNRETISFT